ncbi:hypothetical protein N752_23325 [Desulforamulus aquiferis]|nr:hypothetical protein N752_23325 [Desulforamulus aquiferis]
MTRNTKSNSFSFLKPWAQAQGLDFLIVLPILSLILLSYNPIITARQLFSWFNYFLKIMDKL